MNTLESSLKQIGIAQIDYHQSIGKRDYTQKTIGKIKKDLEEKNEEKAKKTILEQLLPIYRYEVIDTAKYQEFLKRSGVEPNLPRALYQHLMMEISWEKGVNIGFKDTLFPSQSGEKTELELWCEQNDPQYKMEKMFENEKAHKKQRIKLLKWSIKSFSGVEGEKLAEEVIERVMNAVKEGECSESI